MTSFLAVLDILPLLNVTDMLANPVDDAFRIFPLGNSLFGVGIGVATWFRKPELGMGAIAIAFFAALGDFLIGVLFDEMALLAVLAELVVWGFIIQAVLKCSAGRAVGTLLIGLAIAFVLILIVPGATE